MDGNGKEKGKEKGMVREGNGKRMVKGCVDYRGSGSYVFLVE